MRRVVITGIGLVTPLGVGLEPTWSGLVNGKSGVGMITLFDTTLFKTKIGAEVKDWDPTQHGIEKREARTMDRFLHFSIVAGRLAMEDAGLPAKLDAELAERAGCYVGAGLGGIITIQTTLMAAKEKGPRHGYSPYFIPGIIVNLAPGHLSIRHNLRGANMSHVSACATGAHSIGEAARSIGHGDHDVMLAGGADATVAELGVGGFNALTALSTRNDDPQGASRPFENDRDGFVLGEVTGYGATSDAHHMTQPAPEGEGAQRCMKKALADAKLAPEQIGYINAHGTSTKFNDANETKAIKAVFGAAAKQTPVSSTKSMTGHLLGAAGGIETAFSALAIVRGVLPPTINYQTPDPECDLDYIPNTAREVRVDHVLSNSFGFGGTNATLIVSRYKGD